MAPQRPGVGAPTAAFVVVILVIVGVMGLVSVTLPSGGGAVSSSTSTTTEEQQPTFFSMVSPSGLQLQLKLNATAIQSGSALIAQITLFNPLDENLSLFLPNLASNSTIATWNDYDFVCSGNSMWNLGGYALFKGHYSSDNVSSAGEPLMLAPPVAYLSCINNTRNLFVFLPNNSNAMVSDSSETGQPATPWHAATNATTESCENISQSIVVGTHCPVGDSLFGYWSAPLSGLASSAATTSSSYFHYFSPGQYTLAVEDSWGQTIYAHFQVTGPGVTTKSSTTHTSSCYSGPLPSNSSSSAKTVAVYDVTPQFNSWQWNGTSFEVSGYTLTAVGYSNTAQVVYQWPKVFFEVSNGQTGQSASFTNLGAWNGQSWPPDFPQSPDLLFNGNVTLQWIFTCDMRVLLEVSVIG
jgi:hypothetical protein